MLPRVFVSTFVELLAMLMLSPLLTLRLAARGDPGDFNRLGARTRWLCGTLATWPAGGSRGAVSPF